jgi:hypothetical protein
MKPPEMIPPELVRPSIREGLQEFSWLSYDYQFLIGPLKIIFSTK